MLKRDISRAKPSSPTSTLDACFGFQEMLQEKRTFRHENHNEGSPLFGDNYERVGESIRVVLGEGEN